MSFDTNKYALLLNEIEQIAEVSKRLIIKTTLLPEMCQTHKISKAALYQYIKPRKETDDPQYQQKPV